MEETVQGERRDSIDHDFDAYDFLEEDGTYQYLISMRPVEEANECYHLLFYNQCRRRRHSL